MGAALLQFFHPSLVFLKIKPCKHHKSIPQPHWFQFARLDQAIRHRKGGDDGGVLVVVDQALGDVERGDVVVLGLFGEGEDEFVAGAALGVGGLAADGFEALEQVVGGKGGVFPDADHAFAAEHHGVKVGAPGQERRSRSSRRPDSQFRWQTVGWSICLLIYLICLEFFSICTWQRAVWA